MAPKRENTPTQGLGETEVQAGCISSPRQYLANDLDISLVHSLCSVEIVNFILCPTVVVDLGQVVMLGSMVLPLNGATKRGQALPRLSGVCVQEEH